MWMRFIGLLAVFVLVPGLNAQRPTQNLYASGCNGETLNPKCPPFHKIAIRRIYYTVKHDRSCDTAQRDGHACCQTRRDDCIVTDDAKYSSLNPMCSGFNECKIPVSPIPTRDYCQNHTMSDLLNVFYDCVEVTDIKPVCGNEKSSGKSIFMSSDNYPTRVSAGKMNCQCMLKTELSSGIKVFAIDVLLMKAQIHGSKPCQQKISFHDDVGSQRDFYCGTSGLYGFRNIFNTETKNATILFESDVNTGGGYVWIHAKAADKNDFLTLLCGKALDEYIASLDENKSQVLVDTEVSTSSTTATPVVVVNIPDTPPATVDRSTANSDDDDETGAIIAGIVSAIIVLIVIIVIILLILRRNFRRKTQNSNKSVDMTAIMCKQKSKNSSSYCKYYYDEDHFCGIKRSPFKLTKYPDVEQETNQNLREAFIYPEAVDDIEQFENTSFGYYHIRRPIVKSSTQDDIAVGLCSENKSPMVENRRKSHTLGHVTAMNGRANPLSNFDNRPVLGRIQNRNVTSSQPIAMVTPLKSRGVDNNRLSSDSGDNPMPVYENEIFSPIKKVVYADGEIPASPRESMLMRASLVVPYPEEGGDNKQIVSTVSTGSFDADDKENAVSVMQSVKAICNELNNREKQVAPAKTTKKKIGPPVSTKPPRPNISGPIGIESTNVSVTSVHDNPHVILARPVNQIQPSVQPGTKYRNITPPNIQYPNHIEKPRKLVISNPLAVTGTNAAVLNSPPLPSVDITKCLEIDTNVAENQCDGSNVSNVSNVSSSNSQLRGQSPKRSTKPTRPLSVPPKPPPSMTTFRNHGKDRLSGEIQPIVADKVTVGSSNDTINRASVDSLPIQIGDLSQDIFETLEQMQASFSSGATSPITSSPCKATETGV